jgi:hypothetical protein
MLMTTISLFVYRKKKIQEEIEMRQRLEASSAKPEDGLTET